MSEANQEQQAREMGWSPKEEFKGNPDRWVDAGTYVERAETVMPILRKTNEGLRSDLTSVRGELGKVTAALEESRASMKEFAEFQTQFTADKVKAARRELLDRLTQAKKDDDVGAEVEITDELSRLTAAEAAAASERKAAPPPVDKPQPRAFDDPVFAQWIGENPWYLGDPAKGQTANDIAKAIRNDPATTHIIGRPFLDMLKERVERVYGTTHQPLVDKVEGGRSTGGYGGGGNGKTFADLPSDAKDTATRQATKFVGENKAFKDLKAWQDHYAKIFFAE